MVSLGQHLRSLRLAKNVSPEEMARATRVSQRYVEALETDDFSDLPAPVFTRGFIRAYCQVLDVPAEDALRRYAEEMGESGVLQRSAHTGDVGSESRGTGPILVSLGLLVVLGAALFTLTFALQRPSSRAPETAVEQATPPRPAERASAPPTVSARASTPTKTERAPAAPGSPPPVSTAPPANPPQAVAPVRPPELAVPPADTTVRPPVETEPEVPRAYRLVARTTEATWLRVATEDGRSLGEETIPAGEMRQWLSDRRFVLTVGNAGGVTLELNGQSLPSLGPRGAVVRKLVVPPEHQ